MSALYEPRKEEIKQCLDFFSKTLAVTICLGFGSFYQAERFGSTIRMNGCFEGVNQEKADFDITSTGRELNGPINIRSSYRDGEADIVINGRRFKSDDLLAVLR